MDLNKWVYETACQYKMHVMKLLMKGQHVSYMWALRSHCLLWKYDHHQWFPVVQYGDPWRPLRGRACTIYSIFFTSAVSLFTVVCSQLWATDVRPHRGTKAVSSRQTALVEPKHHKEDAPDYWCGILPFPPACICTVKPPPDQSNNAAL